MGRFPRANNTFSNRRDPAFPRSDRPKSRPLRSTMGHGFRVDRRIRFNAGTNGLLCPSIESFCNNSRVLVVSDRTAGSVDTDRCIFCDRHFVDHRSSVVGCDVRSFSSDETTQRGVRRPKECSRENAERSLKYITNHSNRSRHAAANSRPIEPGRPVPTIRPSIELTGRTPQLLFVRMISSASNASEIVNIFRSTSMSNE